MVESGFFQTFLKWHWPWVLVLTQLSLLLFWSWSPLAFPQHCFSQSWSVLRVSFVPVQCLQSKFGGLNKSFSWPSVPVLRPVPLTLACSCTACALSSLNRLLQDRSVGTIWLHLKGNARNCSQASYWMVHPWGIALLCVDSSRLSDLGP